MIALFAYGLRFWSKTRVAPKQAARSSDFWDWDAIRNWNKVLFTART